MEKFIIIAMIVIGILIVLRSLYFFWIQKLVDIKWIETNAEIIKSEFSSRTYGNDVSYAKGESSRRVKLTIKIILDNQKSVIVTRKVWTKTKNRAFFYDGKFVSVLYDQKNPKRFKLKYDI